MVKTIAIIGILIFCFGFGYLVGYTIGLTHNQNTIWKLQQTIIDRNIQIKAMNENDSTHAACWRKD